MTNLDSIFKSRDVTTSTKDHMLKAMVSPVVMCGCESWTIEGWELKNWYFQTVMLEKILASPLDSKEIKLVNLKGNQSWIFIGRTYVDAEAPILWPPDVKSLLIGKDAAAGKDGSRRGKERMRWLNSITDTTDMSLSKLQRKGQEAWYAAVQKVTKSQMQLSNWKTPPLIKAGVKKS